ncbi:hypothetical protein L195_g059436 [Trifolium pratense]|uniref:Uncharacterized protein n=1 Tax=Trifolium pratense TaxID=57577 RepID=A0A2K3JY59_TRIPR|nr:hypothetical protein L195_g059436 [Trifolium pratense]
MDEVQSALRTKELTKLRDLRVVDSAEGLNVTRDRSENEGRGNGKKNGSKSRPKGDNGGRFRCFHCQDPVTSRRTVLREGAVVVRQLMLSLMRKNAMRVRKHS